MTWWGWLILGALLFGAEMLAIDAQFYLVFLGLSAAIVGITSVLGVTMPEWSQWLLFAVLSLISMFTFRKSLYGKIKGNVEGFKEGVAGDFLVMTEDLAAGAHGRTNFRGSGWAVVNDGTSPIAAGDRVRIRSSEGLTLHVSGDPE